MTRDVKLLTVGEAAERLSVSKRTMWGWVAAGKIPAARLSRRATRIKVEDLERFVSDSTKG